MSRLSRTGLSFGAALVVAGLVAGCSSGGSDTSSGSGAAGGAISVVASTDVWGDVVKQIAGSDVEVSSIITNPDADPHSFEANAQVQLKLSKATIVVENGGGYDDFVDSMLKTAGNEPTVINAVDVSGKKAAGGAELNEHVWYDMPTVQAVAGRISDALSQAKPSDASTFEANEKTFVAKIAQLEAREATVKQAASGKGAAITEPVPLYMLEACGLVNKTPAEFSEAIEEGTDVPASVLGDTLSIFTDKQVSLLAYNEQTSGPETDKVLQAAKDNGIAVVPVTETLPDGKDFVSWMTDNLDAIAGAVGA